MSDLAHIIAALRGGQPTPPSFEDRYPSYAGGSMTVMPNPGAETPPGLHELSGVVNSTAHMAPHGLPWQSWRPSTNVEDHQQQSAMNVLKGAMSDPMTALLKHLGSR